VSQKLYIPGRPPVTVKKKLVKVAMMLGMICSTNKKYSTKILEIDLEENLMPLKFNVKSKYLL
jgi:hypothetical protein